MERLPGSTLRVMRVVAGDIGGTKTLLQLLEVSDGRREVLLERRYESTLYPRFELLLREFVNLSPEPVRSACFAVAGPVIGEESEVTNLSWFIQAKALCRDFAFGRVTLVNDFHAVAVGVPLLGAGDLLPINEGNRDRSMPIAILGAGTGLGQAIVVPVEQGWRVLASEGGHTDFGPQDALQSRLLEVLRDRYGHVSYERVVSGQGLINIFTFLRDHEFHGETAARDLTADDDLPAKLSQLAAAGDPLASRTFDVFVDIYGAEAGNLALKVLARGGVFLAGGIAAKNTSRFTDGRFLRAFTDKGRFSALMRETPVDLITNTKVGLIGAVEIAVRAVS
jgi:glucokinase